MDNALSLELFRQAKYSRKVLNGTWLKIIGFIFTIIDHIGLMFSSQIGETAYTILRCTGRVAFPIFVFLTIEGVYHTRNYWKYFARLIAMAVILDAFSYAVHYGFPTVGTDLVPGNVFTDLALGSLVVYLFKRNDKWTMLSLLPIAYLVLSDFTVYRLGESSPYAIIPAGIASDYGTFGLCMFILFYFAYQLTFRFLNHNSKKIGVAVESLAETKSRLWLNIAAVLAVLANAFLFQILWYVNVNLPILPSPKIGGWPSESWSCLAVLFFFLYDGRPGLTNKAGRYSLYLFYPIHLLILWLITLAF